MIIYQGMTGKTLAGYQIAEKLGGPDSEVYRAHDTKLGRDVMIRFLPKQNTANDELWEQFLIYSQCIASINSPYVAAIYAIEEPRTAIEPTTGESSLSDMFIVTEFVQGRALKAILQRKPLKLKGVLYCAKRIASGLQSVHNRGIVHGELTSSNIWLNQFGKVKIMNLGLSMIRSNMKRPESGFIAKPSPYMSPEQVQGEAPDFYSDMWAYGVLLYEMLTARLPFWGTNGLELKDSIRCERPEDIYKFRPETPIELELFVNALLRKELEQRPKDFATILRRLKKLER